MTLVCPDCFGDIGLKRRIKNIRPKYENLRCNFHPSKKGIPVEAVSKIVDEVFRSEYAHGEYNPYLDKNSGLDLVETLFGRTGATDDDVVRSLADSLIANDDYWPPDGEEAFYDHEGMYVQTGRDHDEHSRSWETLRQKFLHRQRYFNTDALSRLHEIFDGLQLLRSEENKPAIYEISPGGSGELIFRGRKCNSEAEQADIAKDPSGKLGPPPKRLRRAGRMNSSGILAFYGAMDINTCVSELRPAVGETIVYAQFTVLRPILVLDTTRFSGRPKPISIFAESYLRQMRLWKFMASFMDEISRPCLPEDEHLDYVPTQIVSEYLTNLHKLKINGLERTIDAIIYSSAQNESGRNIAIFGEAGLVDNPNSARESMLHTRPGLKVVPETVAAITVRRVTHVTREHYIQIQGSPISPQKAEDFDPPDF